MKLNIMNLYVVFVGDGSMNEYVYTDPDEAKEQAEAFRKGLTEQEQKNFQYEILTLQEFESWLISDVLMQFGLEVTNILGLDELDDKDDEDEMLN